MSEIIEKIKKEFESKKRDFSYVFADTCFLFVIPEWYSCFLVQGLFVKLIKYLLNFEKIEFDIEKDAKYCGNPFLLKQEIKNEVGTDIEYSTYAMSYEDLEEMYRFYDNYAFA